MSEERKRLTGKQVAFIHHYLTNGFNGTAAARDAGYEGDEATLAVVAYDNLRNPYIQAEIDRLFGEMHMTEPEVLARLALQARGTVTPFLGDDGRIDVLSEEAKKNIANVKEYEVTQGTTKGGQAWTRTKIKLYDAQAALVHIGRHLALFLDKQASGDRVYDEHMQRLRELVAGDKSE